MSDEPQELKTEFKYILQVPFSYAHGGEQVDAAKFVLLKAPTSRNVKECSALKQAFFRSMGEQAGGNAGDEDANKDIQGTDVMALIAMSSKVSLPDVMEIAKTLFQAPGIALVDGESKLKTELMNRMNVEDLERMLGEYLVNFTLASSLTRLKPSTSADSQT